MSLGIAVVVLALLPLPRGYGADEDVASTDRALRRVLRTRLPATERLEAAARALAAPRWDDPELAFRAGVSLLAADEGTAAWMIRRAGTQVALRDALCDEGLQAVAALPAADAPARAATRAALRMVLGDHPKDALAALTGVWPPERFVEAVLRDEFGEDVLSKDVGEARAALRRVWATAQALDDAVRDDATRMVAGFEKLVANPEASLPLLLHEARRAAVLAATDGRVPRACRAIVALGQCGSRAATPVLRKCLFASDGWVRHCAAVALGDLGDPAAIPDLTWYLCRMSDRFRNRDQWDYPGPNATPIAKDAWSSTDYYVIDMMAADALLRLGVPAAANYLIHEKLNPRKANFRIRVYQDAVDALERAGVPSTYNVDQGIPLRRAAFEKLSAWWLAHRDGAWLKVRVDESDAGFVAASRELAEKLRSNDARSFIITKRCCTMIGAPMTPALLAVLAQATRPVARTELAQALGVVRDPRAIEPLLGLLKDPKSSVREKAVLALGFYVRQDARAQAALLQALKSRRLGTRVAALQALVRAQRDPKILTAVRAVEPDDRNAAIARTVIELVQEGMTHWPAVQAGLRDPVREIRRTWWDLLRAALDLPPHLHDAQSPPDAKNIVQIDRARIEAARAAVPEQTND